jgi:signal transduction histidine kinase
LERSVSAFLLGTRAISELIVRNQPLGHFVGAAFTISAAWAAGRAIRTYRPLSAKLRYSAARLAAEREDRVRLTVAGERSRIARELHAIVADRVAAMVVQAEGARTMLLHDRDRADRAMGNVEHIGRQTLAQMRRILGVLRVHSHQAELEPQPGVAQLYSLIQRARTRGQKIELNVAGDPGTLPAAVDIGL